jgi:hypothetical protein
MTANALNTSEFLQQAAAFAVELVGNSRSADDSDETRENEKWTVSQQAEIVAAEKAASEIIARADIRSVLCPGLLNASNDVRDIAKASGGAILPLVLAGAIHLPLTPLAFGVFALVVIRAGLRSLCREFKNERSE